MAHTAPSPSQLLTRLVVVIVTVGSLFALAYLGALHAPEPNDVTLGVVGPSDATKPMKDAIETAAPGAFEIDGYSTPEQAREAIMDRDLTAALVPGEEGLELLVAGAGGAMAKNNLVILGETVAEKAGAELTVTDLAPLPSDDRAGLSPFLLIVSILIPSLLMGVIISLAAAAAAPAAKLLAASVGGLGLGMTNTFIAGVVYGALDGHYWELAALTTLTSWAIALPIIAAHRLLGAPGIGLMALLFMVLGMPATGAAIGPDYIPEFFQFFTLAFPPGEAIPAVRNITYFAGADVTLSILLLSTWALLGAAVLAIKSSHKTNDVDRADALNAA